MCTFTTIAHIEGSTRGTFYLALISSRGSVCTVWVPYRVLVCARLYKRLRKSPFNWIWWFVHLPRLGRCYPSRRYVHGHQFWSDDFGSDSNQEQPRDRTCCWPLSTMCCPGELSIEEIICIRVHIDSGLRVWDCHSAQLNLDEGTINVNWTCSVHNILFSVFVNLSFGTCHQLKLPHHDLTSCPT